MADHQVCQVMTRYRGVESRCLKEAAYFTAYFNDGTDGLYCCAAHLARAVEAVLGIPGVSKRASATVWPLQRKEQRTALSQR
ncbi:hypothetical protein GCM10009754_35850 [Amycolatopsis minnesotensis]|uniref:Uncharacterized protein n=1 Tax=Amycolatopsis minnesotensis TaxID=337894 RepID=A0ABP5CCA8_9PSEU